MWRVLLIVTLVGSANGGLQIPEPGAITHESFLAHQTWSHGAMGTSGGKEEVGLKDPGGASRDNPGGVPSKRIEEAPAMPTSPRGMALKDHGVENHFSNARGGHSLGHGTMMGEHLKEHDHLTASVGEHLKEQEQKTGEHGAFMKGNHAKNATTSLHALATSSSAMKSNALRFRSFADLSQPHYKDPASVPMQMFSPEAMASLTTPQPPTLPPALDAYRDHQPMDTAMGSFLMNQFVEPMTVTPPPSQSALDLAYGCPALLEFPVSVTVNAPSGCGSVRYGTWQNAAGDVSLMSWSEVCTPNLKVSAFPIVRYSLPNGDIFGYSREAPFKGGKSLELLDCGLRVLYTMDEKLVRDKTGMSGAACEKYGSCDGAVYVQYNIYKNGALVASSPYLTLFQDTFKWTSPTGLEVATTSRLNAWSPRDKCPSWSKKWLVRMNPSAPPPFNDVSLRWPIAEAVTMFSLRDDLRDNTGQVSLSGCEYKSSGLYLGILIASALVVLVLTGLFHVFFHNRLVVLFSSMEDKLFPKAVYRPLKFDP